MSDVLPTDVHGPHFDAWTTYWGELFRHVDTVEGRPCTTVVYGWENVSDPDDGRRITDKVPTGGAVYGFLATGDAWVGDDLVNWRLRAGQWFALPDGARIHLVPGTASRLMAAQRLDYHGLRTMGGPIEPLGRLRYIDRCSDTVLSGPPLLGDPCLNHLHFPPGIDQTEHTHPSIRAGIVARGSGWCATPAGSSKLEAGVLFSIPCHGRHNFLTGDDEVMDVIAYHPDSDWGPTHDDHPMVNRTWVDGEKIDNTTGVHLLGEVVVGDRRPIA